MARQQKERSERERQRAEQVLLLNTFRFPPLAIILDLETYPSDFYKTPDQERRKEKEEEDALEQVFIRIHKNFLFF